MQRGWSNTVTVSRSHIEGLKKEYKDRIDKSYWDTTAAIDRAYPDKLDVQTTRAFVDPIIEKIKEVLGDTPNSVKYVGASFDLCRKMEKIDISVYLDVDCNVITYYDARDLLNRQARIIKDVRKKELESWGIFVYEELLQKKQVPKFDSDLHLEIPEPTPENLVMIQEKYQPKKGAEQHGN